MQEERSLYDEAGGFEFFERLVDRFYDGVEKDAVLRAVYPEEDLTFARRKLALFLAEYWGGPGRLQRAPRAPRAPEAARAVRDRRGRTQPVADHMRAAVDSGNRRPTWRTRCWPTSRWPPRRSRTATDAYCTDAWRNTRTATVIMSAANARDDGEAHEGLLGRRAEPPDVVQTAAVAVEQAVAHRAPSRG